MKGNSAGPRNADLKTINDFAIAVYAAMKGLELVKASEHRKNGRFDYRFTFRDPAWIDPSTGIEYKNGRLDKLTVDFVNSEAAQYDATQRRLKKLLKRDRYKHK